MLPAAEDPAPEPVFAGAGLREVGAGGDGARLQPRERGERLQGGSRRVCRLDRAVEERIIPAAAQLVPALLRDPGRELVRVVVGLRGQREHFPVTWIDRDYGAPRPRLERILGRSLHVQIYRQFEIGAAPGKHGVLLAQEVPLAAQRVHLEKALSVLSAQE